MLKFLLGFFALAVGDPDPDPQADLELDPENPDPAPQGDPEPEPADEGADPEPDAKAQLAEERRARAADHERFDREMNEVRARAPQPQTEDQKIFDEEERRLKAADASDLEKWQIKSNREIRASKSYANSALAQAQDISDRTAFRQLEVTKPALFKRYAVRVEEELIKARRAGSNVPREAILRFLIGNDALDGKLAPRKKAADPAPTTINRGKLPGAKSDVRGKTTMTEHEKRRARLQDVQI